MGDIFKLALRLFVFALVAAVALAMTNEVTKGPIEAQKLAAKMEALNTVLPGCEYAQIEYEGLAEGSSLDEIFEGKDASGAVVGYALTAAPQGYGGPIPITVGISTEGHITQTFVGALQETAGLGTKVGEADFKDQFIAIAADPDTLNDDVDTIGGATVSSSAFVGAVSEILTYSKNTLGIAPAAGDKEAILAAAAAAAGNAEPVITTNTYDVNGFGAMKVEVAVDDAGKIVSVKVLEHNETPGFGADLIADTAVFDALVGQDIAGAAIDVKAGVTMTSKAINAALKAAGPQVPTDPYTVKGFGKFTMNVAVQDGVIAAINAPVHGETPGFGADILTEDALAYLVGQDIATAQVDMKSGVTMTSNAIADALKQAAAANGIAVEAAAPAADATTAATAAAPAAEAEAAAGNVYDVKGFQPMKVAVEVDEAGKIVSVNVTEHNETPGFGADLIGAGFDALVGQDIATAQIDVKSGVTMTSNGINDALKAAAAAAPAAEAAPAAGNVYDVKGFQPMKVAVEVDDAGKIISVNVTEHNETPGFGADLIGAGFDALVGQDIATAQIDVKSGVTMTSNGINDALKAAAAAAPAAAPAEEAAAETAAAVYEVKGFQPMKVAVDVDEAGKIVSVNVTEHNETPGFGADLIGAGFDALVGQDIATAAIDVKSGVTMTSNGINEALKAAAAAAPAAEVEEEAAPVEEAAAESAAAVYEVKGFQPMKVAVEVDEAGKIVSVNVVEHNETPGFGVDLIGAGFDALVGQDIATAAIDVKSGVTMTSNGINEALKAAAAAAPAAEVEEEAAPVEEAAAETAAVVYEVKGFQPMKVAIDVDEAGKIVSVNVTEHNETPGFGADLIGAGFDALVGQDIATAQIDVKSGVTMTSNGINDALKAAAAAAPVAEVEEEAAPVEEVAAESAAAVYEVKGFQPMKVAVEVDEAGKIVSVNVTEHNETPGFGADLIGAGFDALVGQDIATAQIDVKSGVTMTSNGINDALKAAAAAAPAAAPVEEAPAEEAAAPVAEVAKVYEVSVMGMNSKHPLTLNVSVDAEGVIVKAECTDSSEDKGAAALTAEALAALVGQNVADAKYDAVAGATVTSNAVNQALDIIAAHVNAAAAPAEEAVAEAAPVAEVAKVYEVSVMGMNSKHPLTLSISVDAEGVIAAAECTDSSEDKGAAALTAEALAALVGQNITDAKYDTVAGATVTSNAVNQALDTIAAHVRAEEVQ